MVSDSVKRNRAKTRATYRKKHGRPGHLKVNQWRNKLKKGEKIQNAQRHHKGMTLYKEELGFSRPEGMTLSLINPCSPFAYWGYKPGRDTPYRLSTDPKDYVWESMEDNNSRSFRQGLEMYEAGLIDRDGKVIKDGEHEDVDRPR